MDANAPALFVALEQSALAQTIRQSSFIYPAANVAHILGLVLYAASVAILDLRLLGAFGAVAPGALIAKVRRAAMATFTIMLLSGAVLFTAEASHLAMNPVFRAKVALIGLALTNAVVMGGIAERAAAGMAPGEAFDGRVRAAAVASLALWLSVAAAGRLIAYV